MDTSGEANPDLESFREQWRAEVRARQPTAQASSSSSSSQQPQQQQTTVSVAELAAEHHLHPRKPPPAPAKKVVAPRQDYEDDYVQPRSFDAPNDGAAAPSTSTQGGWTANKVMKDPVTALDHYEKAVEREAAGSLGDSLKLYRKAFRMDDSVDQKYRNKYFPKQKAKPPAATPGTAGGTESAAAASTPAEQPQTMKELINSFAGLAIEPAGPPIEGMPPPPCPMASLPEELLVHILRDVAILDVADFVRLAQVCKKFAFLVATEDRIWRRICLGDEFGFGAMHYHWQRQLTWEPLTEEDLLTEFEEQMQAQEKARAEKAAALGEDAAAEDDESTESPDVSLLLPLTPEQRTEKHYEESRATTLALYKTLYNSSWLRMWRLRPRIRFNGCYISTVNYIRAGQASANATTWGSPVHIVTYYRYLRFFRDGTAISLLTTSEPADVVYHLTREAVALHAGKKATNANAVPSHLPSAPMQYALKGRWRLTSAADSPAAPLNEIEGDLIVETEGVGKYIYRLDLTLKSAGKMGAKNNKLVWRGFYNYDRMTDDWGEFTLKHDKPFFFSRVKSYGVLGE
ncbi:hypothetical protein SMACR_02876 [Sordaria macrospora]|uniref:WGS project CABT00000000 data, contig 2.12 n=2 Tax=Sordaria macrospora TaxID=5147 RepID=F7VXQ5_SORMK|nr:uncharacterized protein SMAC_02876 [Sordaria macrospora k-hell]KAA8632847.1 hypothetical protein SMACR_02876 [Sordaria macrospora]KAH7635008.1 hypothetical protein B0T09DRAFT_16059 [Sordaria sp. MPI-SDFR-AT-0083]WPJ58230.1 hypothetical protein SMAC4_02876 [Sordaria macrospora]CCC10299.1 unnamed protein product [Sordaria macrospora k-hell]